ncbi:corticotropin-releasing factor-binding protein-like [Amphibalanus amphitrite]|uniref:corticotropin-releasing factor-binding protein-like n=1 Tax=Amphibalanus amphitrite TaxID=1232801 RepID=UPI001C9192FF|nr:corticotropin-releasing factor-binding protein-like [Amphibalanus amphitrite]
MYRGKRLLSAAVVLAHLSSNVLPTHAFPQDVSIGKPPSEDEHSPVRDAGAHHIIRECINTTSADGTFYIKSSGDGSTETCGLYLFSDANNIIEVQLNYVSVPCHTGGRVALVDGWEMMGELWPSPSDHGRPVEERTIELCGTAPPPRPFVSEQNAVLLQYRLPAAGSALSVRVRHLPNPRPCNQLMDGTTEVFSLRNFGQRRNCTLFSMSPVEVQVLPFRVGAPLTGGGRRTRAALTSTKCARRGWPDFVELGEATGLDTDRSAAVSRRLCGISSSAGPPESVCGMFVTRLVSSGLFDNHVLVRARLLPFQQMLSLCAADYGLDDQQLEESLKDYSW